MPIKEKKWLRERERERERVFTHSTKLKINQTYIKEREDQKFDKGKDILRGNFMCRM